MHSRDRSIMLATSLIIKRINNLQNLPLHYCCCRRQYPLPHLHHLPLAADRRWSNRTEAAPAAPAAPAPAPVHVAAGGAAAAVH